ncbi:MAG: dTDP-4-dehydrorhamnose reductase [Desulfomonilaceae bacterium]
MGERNAVVVIGAAGMLGKDLVPVFQETFDSVEALDLPGIDIGDMDSVEAALERYASPVLLLNLAAMTDVDGCETRIEEAYRINGQGPANLARFAAGRGHFLVQISTDYVFDGTKREPYREDDPPAAMSVYGKSKAQGEERVRATLPDRSCIVRTSWLYGPHGKNFVEAILAAASQRDVLEVVNDQRGRPTYTRDLAEALREVCMRRLTGVYHIANVGEATWYDFAVEITRRAGLSHVQVKPIATEKLGRPAPRPRYSVLDTSLFEAATGMRLRPWQEALADYLENRLKGKS